MTQTAIMEDLQKTEDSLAPVVDFKAFKAAQTAEKDTDNSAKNARQQAIENVPGPYSSRYRHSHCPCPYCPAPLWPAYPQYPWHFPQPFYPDWTYRPYPAYPGVYCGTGTAPVH